MKTILSFLSVLCFSLIAQAQSAAEVSCRAQAKEVAVKTYSSCITEARTARVEQIRSDYQKELAALKEKYDQELRGMNGGKPASKKSAAAKTRKIPQSTKGLPKELPVREVTEAEPLKAEIPAETKVVAVDGSESSSDALEREAAEADQVEFIEMPVE